MSTSVGGHPLRRSKSLGRSGRRAMALLSVASVVTAAATIALVGGPRAGALPLGTDDLGVLLSGDVTLLAVAVVRVAAVGLALWWLGLIVAAWIAAWRGRGDRVGAYARLLPAPLRLAVTLSLAPVLVSLPATMASAQNQPPTGVPSSVVDRSGDPSGQSAPSIGVLELTPIPVGPEVRPGDLGSPTAGTTPAPGLPVAAGPNDASGDPTSWRPVEDTPSAAEAPCPTIVARSDVHWFDQARAHLDVQLGRPASEREAESYWYRCVAHNADRLPDPDEPDIVRPGQVLELPELPQTL